MGRAEWAIALALLDLLFAGFVTVQIAVLFGGRDHVLATAGLTYAEYARQGFFQLLAVAGLVLAVIGGAVRLCDRGDRRDRRLLQLLLGVLSLLTLVVLISALRRLQLYEDTFGFTRLRVSVHATILWLGGLFLLVMAAGVMWRGRWLARATVLFTGVSLLSFTALDPDGLVASGNVNRYLDTRRIDPRYVEALSPDAVTALTSLPQPLRGCVLASYRPMLSEPDPPLGFNLGRARARAALSGALPETDLVGPCP